MTTGNVNKLYNDYLFRIAYAIARMEGYFIPGTIAERNNNPGNLRRWGSLPTESGFAKFPDHIQGWNALMRQVHLNIGRNLSLNEFFAGKPGIYPGYAPASDNNRPFEYALFVNRWLGIDPSTELITEFWNNPDKFSI